MVIELTHDFDADLVEEGLKLEVLKVFHLDGVPHDHLLIEEVRVELVQVIPRHKIEMFRGFGGRGSLTSFGDRGSLD